MTPNPLRPHRPRRSRPGDVLALVLCLAGTAAVACVFDQGCKLVTAAHGQTTQPATQPAPPLVTRPAPVQLPPDGDPWTAADALPASGRLLFPRGATYIIPPGRTFVAKAGQTFGAYGDKTAPRPRLIFTGGAMAFDIRVPQVTLDSLEIEAGAMGGKFPGVKIHDAAEVRIENCSIRNWSFNVVAHRTAGLTIRGSLLADAYTRDRAKYGHTSGIYAYETTGIVFDRTAFVRNGRDPVTGERSIYDHGAYIAASCGPVTVRDCAFVDNASHGLQARGGGDVIGCLFVDNPVGLSHGLVNRSHIKPGGVGGRVERCVFLGGNPIRGVKRGYVAEFGNAAGVSLVDLVAAHDTQHWDAPFIFATPINPINPPSARPSTINVDGLLSYDWPGHPDRRGVLRVATLANGTRERIATLTTPAPVDLRAILGDVEAAARRDPWTAATDGVGAARRALGLDPDPTAETAQDRLLAVSADLTALTAEDDLAAAQRAAIDDAQRSRDARRAALQAERARLQAQAGGAGR